VERFRGGLVVKAHRLSYHSTPGSKAMKKKEEIDRTMVGDSGHSERSEEVAVMTTGSHRSTLDSRVIMKKHAPWLATRDTRTCV